MKIYHNPRCGKSRDTLKLIQAKGIEPEVVEYLKDTPSPEEIKEVLSKLGMKPMDIIRKGETVYKEKFKGKDYSDSQWIDILALNPILIERPIVVKDDKAILGRPPENVKALF